MTSGEHRIIVDGEEFTIAPTTTVAEVKERIRAPANTVLTYDDEQRIRVLEHTDVIAAQVDEGTALTVLPVAEGYPQLEQNL